MTQTAIRFDGQVVVITGAGRGLGRAHAIELARRGARVVVNDLGTSLLGEGGEAGPADDVVAAIRANGGEAVASYDSVASPDSARRIVELACDSFGTVDAVVNNAGTGAGGMFGEMDLAAFRDVIECHLMGSAAVTYAAWPLLRGKGYGRIVMTTSSAGIWGLEEASAYAAAKGALIGLTKSLAHEGAAYGIRVNAVAPGAKTRMSEHHFGDKGGWTWRPELVSPMVAYLASSACTQNGGVFAALAGLYARIEPMQARGVQFDPREDVDADAIAKQIDSIACLDGARSMGHATSDAVKSSARR